MKKSITPIDSEIELNENEVLVSKTDTSGKITYCSSNFIKISGYSEKELLGSPHNIVRHPDMPKVVFRLIWETLKSNREFNGYVKNLRKDGKCYWVFANITPSYSDDNSVIGYHSVRRKPKPEQIQIITGLYTELLELENASTNTNVTEDSLHKLHGYLNGREMGYDEFVLSI